MTDAHERFVTWLADAIPGDPPRDLAVHASGCADCLALASGLDALGRVDLGLAPMPPLRVPGPPQRFGLASVARATAGVAAVALFGFVLISGGAVRESGDPIASLPPNEGVLGAAVGESSAPGTLPATPDRSDASTPRPSDASSPEPDGSPAASAIDASAAPRPLTPVTPPPPAAPAPTAAPTSAPQPTAQPPAPTPSSQPPAPTPTSPPPPSPTPTPTPPPPPTPTPTPEPTCDPLECLPTPPPLPVP